MVIGKHLNFLAKNSIFAAYSEKGKDSQATVYCGFSNFLANSGRCAIFLLFINKLKNRSKPWQSFTPGKVKMLSFAILLWLASDRFLPRCFARLSLPWFANVDFAILFMANLLWCAIGLPMAKCSTFVRMKHKTSNKRVFAEIWS